MNSAERRHIEYRPKLTLSRRLQYVVQEAELPVSQEGTYQMPPELADAVAIQASDLIEKALDVINQGRQLQKELESALASLPGPISVADYRRAQAEGDPEPVAAFEAFHAEDMEGSTEGELLPLVDEIVAEMEDLLRELETTFFPEGIDLENLDDLKEEETRELEALVRQDIKDPSATDRHALETRALLLHAAAEQIDNCQKMLDAGRDLLQHSLADQFLPAGYSAWAGDEESSGEEEEGGAEAGTPSSRTSSGPSSASSSRSSTGKSRSAQVTAYLISAVRDIANAPAGARAGLAKLNEVGFKQKAAASRAHRLRRKTMNPQEIRRSLWAKIRELEELRTEVFVPTLQWMKDVDLQWGTNPLTDTIVSGIEIMERAERERQDAILDLYKLNRLDQLQREDLVANMLSKRNSRLLNRLMGAISSDYDPGDPNQERQVRRLIENYGL